jgi:single-strand DNA-binding protein
MENLAIIIGRLGADPELKYTQEGTPVARFSVATSEKWPDKQSGDMRERVEWHKVEVWNKQGKACADHLKKGATVYVRGELRTLSWDKGDGEKGYMTVINARKVKFL